LATEHVAKGIGSGDVEVLSTPSMVMFMEVTAFRCVQGYLPEGYTTVGYSLDIKHLNPAPLGAEIDVEARLVAREGRRLVFSVRASWRGVVVGEGTHERYIVDRKRFLDKVRRLAGQG